MKNGRPGIIRMIIYYFLLRSLITHFFKQKNGKK